MALAEIVEAAAGTVSVVAMVGVEEAAWTVSVMVMVGVEEETAASEMAEIVGTVVARESVASGSVTVTTTIRLT